MPTGYQTVFWLNSETVSPTEKPKLLTSAVDRYVAYSLTCRKSSRSLVRPLVKPPTSLGESRYNGEYPWFSNAHSQTVKFVGTDYDTISQDVQVLLGRPERRGGSISLYLLSISGKSDLNTIVSFKGMAG